MEPLGFGARLWLAFILPWKILFDGVLAAKFQRAGEAGAAPEALREAPPQKPKEKIEVREAQVETDLTPALQLLAILQREGRFIDFLQEDVSSFSDADIGAAARVVHEGCSRGLKDYLDVAPIRTEDEGAAIELPPGFDAAKVRVTGNVVGEPPFRGRLAHHGWQVTKIHMPTLADGHDPNIVAPAEVEL